jgi:sugar lactone lactonase YvrE
MSTLSRAALLSLAVVLAACGGGGGTGAPAPVASAPAPAAAVGPAITAQPASQSVVAGQAVTFSVAADSTATGYQWQRDGKDIPGATGLTYTLANPQAADNGGKFTAVVTGTRGSTVSTAAVLGVSVPKGPALVAGNPGGIGNLDGTDARLALPGLLAMQPSGALYLVDDVDGLAFSPSVRSIDPATGAVTTLARDPALHDARAIAVDAAGNLYDAPWATGPATAIYRTPPGGKRTLFAGAVGEAGSTDGAAAAARFTEIGSLAADAAGNLYVNDGGKTIRKVAQDGTVSTLAGGAQAEFQQIGALASDRAGNLTLIDNGLLRAVSAAGVVTTRKLVAADGGALSLGGSSITVDGAGNAYMLEHVYPPRVRRIAPDGTVTTAGTLPASGSSGTHYTNLVADSAGNVYVGDDASQTIRRVAAGNVVPFAGRAASQANVDGTGSAAQFALAGLPTPDPHFELATDAQGNVYVGEGAVVRKVTPAGVVTTLPLPPGGRTLAYYVSSAAVDGSVLAVSNGVVSRIDAAGVSHFIAGQAGVAGVADGVGAKATFTNPSRLFQDGQGNIWLTDTVPGTMTDVGVETYRRRIAPDGTVTTLPADTRTPAVTTLYWGKDGTQWGVDTSNQSVVRIAPDGTRTVVRPARDLVDRVTGLTVDRSGNLYLAMLEGSTLYAVRKITPAGSETVIAGTPGAVGVRAGTPGSLGPVDAITVAPDGTVYVMSENALVRILQ